jgi:hypothetical protein
MLTQVSVKFQWNPKGAHILSAEDPRFKSHGAEKLAILFARWLAGTVCGVAAMPVPTVEQGMRTKIKCRLLLGFSRPTLAAVFAR